MNWGLVVFLLASASSPCHTRAAEHALDETTQNQGNGAEKCGIWLGPSPIKKEELHGFGLGMFTGKHIPKGNTVETIYGGAEIVLPLFGSETIYEKHPPLREYVWDEDYMPEIAVEYPDVLTALFMPGLAAIAPCTSHNYNMDVLGTGASAKSSRESVVSDSEGVHRARHATAGSFAYHHNVRYVAVRDIAPGEELTVNCSDDEFDGGSHFLTRFNSNDDAVVCLDQNLRVDRSTLPSSAGRGLFAKRQQTKGDILISTPLIPVHRREAKIEDDRVNSKQLMLNYCYGHPDSDLLLLPYGPLVNYLNGDRERANAEIRWHLTPLSPEKQAELDRRQEHHHPEMFEWSAEKVAVTHGKGLVMDVVALRDIAPGEEILLDYGDAWQRAWDAHAAAWTKGKRYPDDEVYVDAEEYVLSQDEDTLIRTETELARNPYPKNLETFCFYAAHYYNKEYDVAFWDDDQHHSCFRPCRVLERKSENRAQVRGTFYSVEFREEHNKRVVDECVIEEDMVLTDVPKNAIRIMNRPYTTDVLMKLAFRHEIGVPEGFYPQAWMRKQVRRAPAVPGDDTGEEFKRKKGKTTVKSDL